MYLPDGMIRGAPDSASSALQESEIQNKLASTLCPTFQLNIFTTMQVNPLNMHKLTLKLTL